MKMVRNAALVFEKLEIKSKTVCFGKNKKTKTQKKKQKKKTSVMKMILSTASAAEIYVRKILQNTVFVVAVCAMKIV